MPGPKPYNYADYPGLRRGEHRLYLANGVRSDGIAPYHAIRENPEAVIDTDWRTGLRALKQKVGAPAFTGVEIHSHGDRGKILLNPEVRMSNVDEFGLALRALVKPGSLIEVLACMVASFDLSLVIYQMQSRMEHFAPEKEEADALRTFGATYPDEVAEEKRFLEKGYEMRFGRSWKEAFALLKPFIESGAYEFKYVKDYQPGFSDYAKLDKPPVIAWKAVFELGDQIEGEMFNADENGPRFCQRLARASGCTVRAAWIEQSDERVMDGETAGLTGDWEGFVFDFNGEGLQAVHYCLERPVASRATWQANAIRRVESITWVGGRAQFNLA